MCYIGKATKIFIFLVTVLIITGILLGFGILRRAIHPHSHHQCSVDDGDCSQSDSFFPPPEFPIPSSPDLALPPPQSPPSSTNLAPPPPGSSANVAPPTSFAPPPPKAQAVVNVAPPPPVVVVAPPPTVVNPPPSEVPVTLGPVKSS